MAWAPPVPTRGPTSNKRRFRRCARYGALGKTIWRYQDNEIRAMERWRKIPSPQAPVDPVPLAKSTKPTVRRFPGDLIVAQRTESLELRRMLAADGQRKPEYGKDDAHFLVDQRLLRPAVTDPKHLKRPR